MDAKEQEAPAWKELLGSKNWEGLLQPLNINLRQLIIRCGDFCQATYDGFNNDPNSRYAGSSRYGKKSFFHKVMLESDSPNYNNYQIHSFLYATARVGVPESLLLRSRSRESWDRESNWIGYIAVTTEEFSRTLGRREIYVTWRGTTRDYEWIDVLSAKKENVHQLLNPKSLSKIGINNRENRGSSSSSSSSDDEDENVPKVMHGWLTIYVSEDPKSSFTKESARNQLLKQIRKLIQKYRGENLSITMTGHSLGASLSVLSAFDLAENGVITDDIQVTAIIFGSPQIGNRAFNEKLNQHKNLKILHVKNKIDLIPLYPSPLLGYVNTSGTELVIDMRKSPSLKNSKNPSDWHNLQAMLHVVAGWNGENGKFELKLKRSLGLVNKSSGLLKEEYLIPESWWIEKNKGMARDENGEWILTPPDNEDEPVPEEDD